MHRHGKLPLFTCATCILDSRHRDGIHIVLFFLFSALLKRKVMTREFISHLLLGVASIVAVYCISHNVNIDGSRVTIKRSVEQRGLKAHM